jgi:hypothetical protein
MLSFMLRDTLIKPLHLPRAATRTSVRRHRLGLARRRVRLFLPPESCSPRRADFKHTGMGVAKRVIEFHRLYAAAYSFWA